LLRPIVTGTRFVSQFSSKCPDYCSLVLIGMALGKIVAASIAAVVPEDRGPGVVGIFVETVPLRCWLECICCSRLHFICVLEATLAAFTPGKPFQPTTLTHQHPQADDYQGRRDRQCNQQVSSCVRCALSKLYCVKGRCASA
jgi:hypothetical protein